MKTEFQNTEALEHNITFEFKTLTQDVFNKTLNEFGLIVLKNVYSPEEIKKVRDLIFQEIFIRLKLGRELRNDLLGVDEFPKALKLKTIIFLLEGVSDMHEMDKDRLFVNIVEGSGVMSFVERYINNGPAMSLLTYYYARTVDPLEKKFKLGWHQDGTFLRGLADPKRFMICWNPLVAVRDHNPGVQFIAKKFDEIQNTESGGYHSVSMDKAEVMEKENVDWLVAPKINVGDCILFSAFTPHRTYITESMTDIRTSIDFRFYCGDPKDIKG